MVWKNEFKNRIRKFGQENPSRRNEMPVSIKIRITSGCFHREHSPKAYEIIDDYLDSINPEEVNFSFEEHESGPELLVYFAVTTAGITLAKSIIDLLTAVIKARSEGIKKGDHPSHPVELIVRRLDSAGDLKEEVILRFGFGDSVDKAIIEKTLKKGLSKIVSEK